MAWPFVGEVVKRSPGATAPWSAASGPVWYTRTVRSMHESLPAGGMTVDRHGLTRRHGPEVRFDLRVSDETWVRVDGTIRDRTVVAAVRFRSRADGAKWRAYGRPVPNFNMAWLGWISHDGVDVAGMVLDLPGHVVEGVEELDVAAVPAAAVPVCL